MNEYDNEKLNKPYPLIAFIFFILMIISIMIEWEYAEILTIVSAILLVIFIIVGLINEFAAH